VLLSLGAFSFEQMYVISVLKEEFNRMKYLFKLTRINIPNIKKAPVNDDNDEKES
jgi:hypothetical protein